MKKGSNVDHIVRKEREFDRSIMDNPTDEWDKINNTNEGENNNKRRIQ
jgi:hypothetical protein